MKCRIAFFFILFTLQHLVAQTTYVDSLLQLIAVERDDAKRVDLIISIFSPEFEADPALIIETGRQLLNQAENNEDLISEAVQ